MIEFFKKLFRREKHSLPVLQEVIDRAATVSKFYRHYPYRIEWHDGKDIGSADDIYKYARDARLWCVENCVDYHRDDLLGASKTSDSYTDYYIEYVSGEQIWFWAFTNEQDAMLFALRW